MPPNSKKLIRCSTKAIIFDMDGVITNTMPDHFKAWTRILSDVGVHVSYYDVYSREGQRGVTSLQELFGIHKRPYSDEEAKELLAKKEKLFKKIVRIRFIPGARSLLKYLSRQGFVLALVTGTSRHELHQILPDDLYNLFQVVVTGNDVVNGKPSPEPFLLALKQLKIKPQEGVVIENAPFGIQSAKAAKLRCIALETSLPRRYLRKADYIFPSISQMRAKINFVPQLKKAHV